MTFYEDSQRSRRAFERFVAPVLRQALNAKTILPTEPTASGYDSDLAAALDMRAGIDGFIDDGENQLYAYASRIQFGQNYATFTIRRSRPTGARTEFNKLVHARQVQAMMPTFHVQTFVDADGQNATVAIVETLELLRYVYKHRDQWRKTDGGETFYVAPFDDVAAQVYRVGANGLVIEQGKEPLSLAAV